MKLDELKNMALDIRQKYTALNAAKGEKVWGGKDYAMGFVGDVGDLQKAIMAAEGMRTLDDAEAKLGHELADCLWSILVLADHYNIDLEKQFSKTMSELEHRIAHETSLTGGSTK